MVYCRNSFLTRSDNRGEMGFLHIIRQTGDNLKHNNYYEIAMRRLNHGVWQGDSIGSLKNKTY